MLSHEISHIKHRDVLVASIAATVAGAISYLALVGRFGAFGSGSRNRDAGNLALILSFLAPIAAFLVQVAISRGREYDADREGALLSRKPLSLASALEKIERSAKGGARLAASLDQPAVDCQPVQGRGDHRDVLDAPSTWKRIDGSNPWLLTWSIAMTVYSNCQIQIRKPFQMPFPRRARRRQRRGHTSTRTSTATTAER